MDQSIPEFSDHRISIYCNFVSRTTKTRVIQGRLQGKKQLFRSPLKSTVCPWSHTGYGTCTYPFAVLLALPTFVITSRWVECSAPSHWFYSVTGFDQWNVNRRVEVLNWGFTRFCMFPFTPLYPAVTMRKARARQLQLLLSRPQSERHKSPWNQSHSQPTGPWARTKDLYINHWNLMTVCRHSKH